MTKICEVYAMKEMSPIVKMTLGGKKGGKQGRGFSSLVGGSLTLKGQTI